MVGPRGRSEDVPSRLSRGREPNRRHGDRVRHQHEVTPNFHQGIIAYPEPAIAVVCVRDTTILALAEPRVIEFAPTRESGPLTFVDAPGLAAELAENRNSDCSPPPS